MSDIELFRARAREWLESMAPTFGAAARKGLDEEADLSLARRYMALRFDAGFAGIAWDKAFHGQGLSHLHKLAFEAEEMRLGMPTAYFGISLGMPIPVMMRFCEDTEIGRAHV